MTLMLMLGLILLLNPQRKVQVVDAIQAASSVKRALVRSHSGIRLLAAHHLSSQGCDDPKLRVVRAFPKLSRRKAEQAVADGRVRVDGIIVKPSYRLVGGNVLTLDGKRIPWEARAQTIESASLSRNHQASQTSAHSSPSLFEYYKYYKPIGVISTMDRHDRRGLGFALPNKLRRKHLIPVGRLDLDSEGLLLLTNDGRLADAVLQPRNKHEKEYIVTVQPPLTIEKVHKLESGVMITTKQQRGGQQTTALTKPCSVERISYANPDEGITSKETQTLRIVLCEGRNRQIRKMVQTVGSEVVFLKRVRHGMVVLDEMQRPGTVRKLDDVELSRLLNSVRSNTKQKIGKPPTRKLP